VKRNIIISFQEKGEEKEEEEEIDESILFEN
jgi:hypothetical protein